MSTGKGNSSFLIRRIQVKELFIAYNSPIKLLQLIVRVPFQQKEIFIFSESLVESDHIEILNSFVVFPQEETAHSFQKLALNKLPAFFVA